MAYIKFTESESIEHLHSPHLIGRNNPAANTSLNCDLVSRNHASIEWDGEQWLIQDFSRNGTWINGQQIESHALVVLRIGDLIQLGNDDKTGIAFEVQQLEKPQNLVYRPHPDLKIIPIGESNLIPNSSSPDYGLYFCQDRQEWFSHQFSGENNSINDFEDGPHQHGDEIHCAGNRWSLFILNGDKASTPIKTNPKTNIDDVEFRVVFNRSENNVRVTLISKELEVDMIQQRYHSLLATLINLQQKSDDGWVKFHELCKETGKSHTAINLELFLLRHDISMQLRRCKGVSKLIERKADSLRLGISNYSIYRNGKLDQSSDYHF
ncbi:MAG: FHA domain-containing protein [Acidiferrobacterales bacterium]|nr:FHA domain-containing protein [Acidiferrobacterales bacterium]